MPSSVTAVSTRGLACSAAPNPAVPADMRMASETMQNAATAATWLRAMPWRRTMAFWAPIAAISEIDTRKPGRIDCTRES